VTRREIRPSQGVLRTLRGQGGRECAVLKNERNPDLELCNEPIWKKEKRLIGGERHERGKKAGCEKCARQEQGRRRECA